MENKGNLLLHVENLATQQLLANRWRLLPVLTSMAPVVFKIAVTLVVGADFLTYETNFLSVLALRTQINKTRAEALGGNQLPVSDEASPSRLGRKN